MRALVFHGPGDLRVEDRPDPAPGPDEVLLRITATGICGSDLHGYTGENGRRHPGQVMGHETVGRIEATGTRIPPKWGRRPGRVATVNPMLGCGTCPACAAGEVQRCGRRRVIGVNPEISSSFAELMVVPAGNVVVLPGTMPEEHGALVEPLSVGYHAAVRGQVGPDDTVLVVGGGPIGQAAALAARRLGATRVAVSEPSDARRALLQRLEFPTVDPREGNVADQAGAALGGPASVVVDAVGASATLADALNASALGARVVLVGMNAPEVTLAAFELSVMERSVIGSYGYTDQELRDTAKWVASGPPGLEQLVEARVSLDGAPDAFAGLADGTLDVSKILVYSGEVPGQKGGQA